MPCSVDGCTSTKKGHNGLCHRHYHAQYREENRKATKERLREYRYTKLFNLLPGEYDVLKAYQAQHPQFKTLLGKGKMRDAVEHRHKDGMLRGVMDGLLNRAYGAIERMRPTNTAEVLRALADFHENPPAPIALGETVYGIIGRAKYKKKMLFGPHGTKEPHDRSKRSTGILPGARGSEQDTGSVEVRELREADLQPRPTRKAGTRKSTAKVGRTRAPEGLHALLSAEECVGQ